jgi:hypothetical protein
VWGGAPRQFVPVDYCVLNNQIRPKDYAAILRPFLPAKYSPYSPDFNPIELAFAKLKAFVRAARPRTFDQVCELIALALELFTPIEMPKFRPTLRISRLYSIMKIAQFAT